MKSYLYFIACCLIANPFSSGFHFTSQYGSLRSLMKPSKGQKVGLRTFVGDISQLNKGSIIRL